MGLITTITKRGGELTAAERDANDAYLSTLVSGVPAGGTTGQVLAKNSNADGDAGWAAASAVDSTARASAAIKSVKRAINAQTGTTYTLALTDGLNNGNAPFLTLSNSGAITVTIPLNATVAFPVGDQVDLAQLGAGKVTIAGADGVTVNSLGGNLSVAAQYSGLSLIKTATDTWLVLGNTIA